jgi:hypothetical protein
VAHHVRSKNYKKSDQSPARFEILQALRQELDFKGEFRLLTENADALDAVVCLLAAKDFLEGRALPPEDSALAVREGWIWVSGATP